VTHTPDGLQRNIPTVSIVFLVGFRSQYGSHRQLRDIVPCSDGAGEIVALGEEVKGWKVGDRVCPNFALDHIHGDVTEEIKLTGLGGHIDGVLREYINVPVHVCVLFILASYWLRISI
jgi:NADPH:quinone reductase-like Zn-dependent oxidoreductase